MKLELKAIKYAAFASQETNCFEAKIYKDGKPWAHISNEGHGGPDALWPLGDRPRNDKDFWKEVEARLQDHLNRKDMKAALRKKAIFVREGEAGIWQMGYRGGKKPDAALYAEVEKKHPGAKILNTMPEDQALAIWKRAA